MKSRFNLRRIFATIVAGALLVGLCGCSTLGGPAADVGLSGAGGVAGYHLTDGKVGGAAAGAAVGYVASRLAQVEVRREVNEAEQRGYDRALNQAVKQQYWIIQEQQKTRDTTEESAARLIPVVIPETKINGMLVQAHVEYLRVP